MSDASKNPTVGPGQRLSYRPTTHFHDDGNVSYGPTEWTVFDEDGRVVDKSPGVIPESVLDNVARDVLLAKRRNFMQGIEQLRHAGYELTPHEADVLFHRSMARQNKTPRAEVYAAIDTERDYQDKLPLCRGDGSPKSVGEYLTLLRAYSAKADSAWTDNPGDEKALHVIRKIAGIAVYCMEIHGAPPRVAN